jgi:hypothetical protein
VFISYIYHWKICLGNTIHYLLITHYNARAHTHTRARARSRGGKTWLLSITGLYSMVSYCLPLYQSLGIDLFLFLSINRTAFNTLLIQNKLKNKNIQIQTLWNRWSIELLSAIKVELFSQLLHMKPVGPRLIKLWLRNSNSTEQQSIYICKLHTHTYS